MFLRHLLFLCSLCSSFFVTAAPSLMRVELVLPEVEEREHTFVLSDMKDTLLETYHVRATARLLSFVVEMELDSSLFVMLKHDKGSTAFFYLQPHKQQHWKWDLRRVLKPTLSYEGIEPLGKTAAMLWDLQRKAYAPLVAPGYMKPNSFLQSDFEQLFYEMWQAHESATAFYDSHIAKASFSAQQQKIFRLIAYYSSPYALATLPFPAIHHWKGFERARMRFMNHKALSSLHRNDSTLLPYLMFQAVLGNFWVFNGPLKRLSRIEKIRADFSGENQAYLEGWFWSAICDINRAYHLDMDQKQLEIEAQRFLQNCPYPAYAKKVKTACFPEKHEWLNKSFDFAFENQKGEKVQLRPGKVVLIDFWATWCKPCLEEAEHIPKLLDKFAEKDFEVIALSFDLNIQNWRNHLDQNPTSYKNWHVGKNRIQLQQGLNINRFPRYLLLDRSGKMVDIYARRPSDEGLVEDIQKYL